MSRNAPIDWLELGTRAPRSNRYPNTGKESQARHLSLSLCVSLVNTVGVMPAPFRAGLTLVIILLVPLLLLCQHFLPCS